MERLEGCIRGFIGSKYTVIHSDVSPEVLSDTVSYMFQSIRQSLTDKKNIEKVLSNPQYPAATDLSEAINKLLHEKGSLTFNSEKMNKSCELFYDPAVGDLILSYSEFPENIADKGTWKESIYLLTQYNDVNSLKNNQKKIPCLVTAKKVKPVNKNKYDDTLEIKISHLNSDKVTREAQLRDLRNYCIINLTEDETVDRVIGLEDNLNENIESGSSTMVITIKPFMKFNGRTYQTTIPRNGSVKYHDFDHKSKESYLTREEAPFTIISDPENPRDFILEIQNPKGVKPVSDYFINGIRDVLLGTKVRDPRLSLLELEIDSESNEEIEIESQTERKKITKEKIRDIMNIAKIPGYNPEDSLSEVNCHTPEENPLEIFDGALNDKIEELFDDPTKSVFEN